MIFQDKPKINTYFLCLLLLLITFVVFIPSLSLHFVDWDDPEYLYKNPALEAFKTHWSWGAVYEIFTSKIGANYDPLPVFTYALERCFVAPNPLATPFIFHLDNLLLHLCCTVCVFFLFLKLGVSRTGAFLGALLFSIHPMRVESVAWITERKDVLYGLFYLLALLAYVNYIKADKEKQKWYIMAIVLSVFSYFSKIQAVSLPLSMVAVDIYFHRKWYLTKILFYEKLPWWSLSALIGLINLHLLNALHVINSEPQLAHYNLVDKLAVGAYSYLVYVVKFIYPYEMVHWYVYPVKLPVIAYISLCLLPVLIILLAWKIRKNVPLLFGWLFFTFNVMFLLQIVPAGKAFHADRFTYVAYTGLFFIVAFSYDRFVQSFPKRTFFLQVFLGAYLALFAFMTFTQEKVWKNTFTLWTHYIREYPKRVFGYTELGSYCITDAINNYTVSNMGKSREELLKIAFVNFNIANDIDSSDRRPQPENTLAIFEGLGSSYAYANNYDSAIYYFTREIAIKPDGKDEYADRAINYYHKKNYALALTDYHTYIQLDPTDDGAYYRSALCEGFLGKYREGVTDINTAIVMDSTQADYYFTRAKLYRLLDVIDSSRADAQKAKLMGAHVADKWLQ